MPVTINEFEILAEPPVQPPPVATGGDRPPTAEIADTLRRLLAQSAERAARVRAY